MKKAALSLPALALRRRLARPPLRPPTSGLPRLLTAPVDPHRLSEWTRAARLRRHAGPRAGHRGRNTDGRLADRAVPRARPRAGRREWRLDPARAADPHPGARRGRLHRSPAMARRSRLRSPARHLRRARCARPSGSRSQNAPMVFVGYGVTAPERGWDDFGDVDLNGKIAVFLVNDPDFEAAARASRGRPVRRPGDDLLRPLDLQVRGGGAARRDRRAGHPRDARPPAMAGTRCRRRRARPIMSCSAPGAPPAGAAAGLDPARRRRRPVPPRRARFRGGEAAGARLAASARSTSARPSPPICRSRVSGSRATT